MPDAEMETRHIERFEGIRARLLEQRAFWEKRNTESPEAIRMMAQLDKQIALNAILLVNAREAARRS